MTATIEQELALLSQCYEDFPQRAQRVRTAIEEGHMLAASYISGSCGCFYGHFVGLEDANEAARIAGEVDRILGQETYEYTPIELLLVSSESTIWGATHTTSEALATLYKALEPYVETKEEGMASHG